MSGTNHPTPDPNTCDHGVPLHEECDRCWHDHRVRVDSRTSKNRTLDRFIDLMQQYGAAFAAYEHHHGAWEVDRLAQAREALIAQYRTDGAEIERLTRELEVEKEVNDLAYTSPRHLVKSRNRLLAMLLELQDEIQAVMNGEHGADWADHFAPLFNLVQRAKALSGEHSAPETSERRSLPPGPERIAAQIAHATYHIIDDHGAEDAQTGVCSVEIPKREWDEWNRIVDLFGDDPHEALHDLIGVNDPEPSEKASAVQDERMECGCPGGCKGQMSLPDGVRCRRRYETL